MKWIFLFLTSALCIAAAPKKELSVGVVLRFKDKFNTTIFRYQEGIETAAALFEKENPDVHVNLRKFPHGESLESVSESAENVIESKFPAVIGPEWSSEAVVLADKLAKDKVTIVTPTASTPELTQNRPHVFRVCFADDQVAEKLAQFVVKKLKPRVLGVFKNVSIPYSNYLGTEFRKKVIEYSKSIGVTPPDFIEKEIISGTSNFSELIKPFKEKGVSVVASFVMDGDFSALTSSAGRQNFHPIYIGSDSWGSNEYVFKRYVNESPYGSKFIAYRNYYWKEDLDSPMIQRFRKMFQEKFHTAPNAFNAIGFDAAWTLLTAMNKAKNPESGESIQKALKEIHDLELVTSQKLSFGPNNSPMKDLYIYKISKSGTRYEGTLK